MSAPIPPPRQPLPGVALALAEAALQRQTSLLDASRAPTAPASAQNVAAAETAGLPPPAVPDRVSLSPQAQQALGAAAAAVHTAPATAGGAARMAPPMRGAPAAQVLSATPQPLPAGAATPPTELRPTTWPTSGVNARVQALITAMVQNLTRASVPQRVVGIQPWPVELVRLLESDTRAPGDREDGALPALQTWLVRQGSLQTPEGARNFVLTLKAPAAWLAQQPPPAAAPAQGEAPSMIFAGRPQTLQVGAFALVLQSTETAARTSALLTMELAPLAQATVYGREMLQARQDPWLQMAVLQASGQWPRDEDLARDCEAGLCQTPGCPYAGRAACPQPFCPALRGVSPVTGVDGGAGGANGPPL
jgi:hypothetical protein